MKKLFTIIGLATIFAACSSNDKGSLEIKKETVPLDTTGLYKSNINTDTARTSLQKVTTQQKTVTTTTQPVQAPPPPPQVVYKTRTVVHEHTKYIHDQQAPKNNTSTTSNTTTNQPSTGNKGTTTNGNSGNGNVGSGNGTANNGGIVPATPVPERKKGWSDAAKDATIGGVGGAVGGAIISKNKGKGAIIGGILGAAGGYILGRKKDKNNGRDTLK